MSRTTQLYLCFPLLPYPDDARMDLLGQRLNPEPTTTEIFMNNKRDSMIRNIWFMRFRHKTNSVMVGMKDKNTVKNTNTERRYKKRGLQIRVNLTNFIFFQVYNF